MIDALEYPQLVLQRLKVADLFHQRRGQEEHSPRVGEVHRIGLQEIDRYFLSLEKHQGLRQTDKEWQHRFIGLLHQRREKRSLQIRPVQVQTVLVLEKALDRPFPQLPVCNQQPREAAKTG